MIRSIGVRALLLVLALAVAGAPLLAQEGETAAEDAGASASVDGERAAAPETEEEEPEDERVRITVAIGAERGGGSAEVLAEDVRYQPGEYLIADGGIELRYQDLVLTAARARLDLPTNLLTAEGGVVLDEGPRRLTGDSLEYNIELRTGRLINGTAFVAPDYYFSGAELAKIGAEEYSITDGVFTSCSEEVPPWSIATSRAKITIEEYARIKSARMRFKRVPVLYVPYLRWPVKTERSTGWLIPKPGYNSRRGGHLGLAYFQTMGRSADATFMAEAYTEEYFGAGVEVRYVPSLASRGALRLFAVDEPEQAFFEDRGLLPDGTVDPDIINRRPVYDPTRRPGDTRWKVALFHETENIFQHFRGVINFQDYSDFEYLADYDRTINRTTVPYIYSDAYLSGNIGPHSINFLVDRREFLPTQQAGADTPADFSDDVFARSERLQLPEIEYRLRSTRLGATPLYLSMLGSANSFSITGENRGLDFDFSYTRLDLQPTFSLPLSSLAWLSAKLSVGGRFTQYSRSLPAVPAPPDDPILTNDDLEGSLDRTLGIGALEVVGPSISRVFEKRLGPFAKFKHVVEPRWDVNYTSDFEEEDQVLFFDEIDRVLARSDAVLTITNRLIAKPAPSEEEETAGLGGAFEIASFALAQGYSFDNDRFGQQSRFLIEDPVTGELVPRETSQLGPLVASLRLNPSRRTSLRLEATYSTLFDTLQSSRISGNVALGSYADLGISWFTDYDVEPPESPPPNVMNPDRIRDQLQLSTKLAVVPQRLYLDAGVRYDLKNEQTLAQAWGLRWQGSCYALQLNWQEQNFRGVRDTDLRFLFTLKNVGTFLDINGNTNSF